MTGRSAGYSAIIAVILALTGDPHASSQSVLDMFAPELVLNLGDRQRLDRGEPVVQVMAGSDGQLSLTAAVAIDITATRLLAWAAAVEALQKGRYVPEIGRFSSPPRLEDLDGLVVADDDLRDLGRCRPGDCGVKLSSAEMSTLAGVRGKAELAALFKAQIVRRATDYLRQGDAAAQPYHDHQPPVFPGERFGEMLRRLTFLGRSLPCYAEYLLAYPAVAADTHIRQSFLYWSKETLGMKPIISITHFSAARFNNPRLPEAVVVARQVYATHYKNASITVTALVADNDRRYLVYLNNAHVDAFRGFFGGIIRRAVERRVRAEAPAVLRGLRVRLQSGDPPGSTAEAMK